MERNDMPPITVLGVEFSLDDFPHLYRWAQQNPKGLAETLKSIHAASGGKGSDYTMVAVNLESDLQHG